MNKLFMFVILGIGMMSCGKTEKVEKADGSADDRVEVVYFHGKQRCATCLAIEENAKSVVGEFFSEEVKNGTVVFKTVDISTPEGESMADDYEVTWSSLFVNKWKNGTETRNDLTEFGFANARSNPDEFKKGLTDKIRQELE